MVNFFDTQVIHAINQYARHSAAIDQAIGFLANSHLLKGGLLITLLWYAWFSPGATPGKQTDNRCHLLATLIGSFVAMALARALASQLPFRQRPLHVEALELRLPFGMDPALDEGWWASSAFPSDHAVLFFALAGGLWFVHRYLGVFAVIYAAVFISLPRIYLGLHFPTDILAGAGLGLGIIYAANTPFMLRLVASPLLAWFERKPAWCYPMLLFVTYQIADMFESSRALVGLLLALTTNAAV